MVIVGIAGGTGCGKTTVVKEIAKKLNKEEVAVISQDSYYKDTGNLSYQDRCAINYDHPEAIDFELLVSHLMQLNQGKSILCPVYSFKEHKRTPQTLRIFPKKIILVEGILILAHLKLRELFDIKVFLETESDIRLIRRIQRDIKIRGRDIDEILARYQATLKPMHQQFIVPTKAFADVIVTNNESTEKTVSRIIGIIKQRLF